MRRPALLPWLLGCAALGWGAALAQTVMTSPTMTPGQMQAFVAAATALSGKLFSGSGSTQASGAFTVTISPACASPPTIIVPAARAPGTGLSNATNASVSSATTSTVTSVVTLPATLSMSALGLTVIPPPAGTAVSVVGLCP